MPALRLFDDIADRVGADSRILSVFETKVFYLFRGRNAWHSTWVTHYFDGCMHDSFASAKARAEDLRGPGSVFTIRQQPALAFKSGKGVVLLTEINASVPLGSWIRNYRDEKSDFLLNQYVCRLEMLFKSRCAITKLVDALGDLGIFPVYPPTQSEHFFILWTSDRDALVEDRQVRTKRWRSSSAGAAYYLDWEQEAAKVSGKAVRRVADAIAHQLEHRAT